MSMASIGFSAINNYKHVCKGAKNMLRCEGQMTPLLLFLTNIQKECCV